MNSKIVIDFLANASSMQKGAGQVIGSLDKIQTATKRVRQAIFGVGVALSGAMTAAGFKAASFEEDMRNVNSITQDTEVTFQKTSDSVLDLATKIPRSANELAKGAYQIVSAGFTAPKQMTDILAQSGKAASAGLTSVDTAALAVVTTLNAYGDAAGSAEHVSDLLFQTVNVGQVSFEQLATNLGDFIGIANAAGGTLAETLSAYSSVTIATGQASRAATSIQGVYRAFVKPSEAMTAAIEKQGFASGKAMIQQLGLQGTLDTLTQSVGGSEVAIAQMFQDTEGLSGVLALTGANAERAREGLAKFTDESKINGATGKALAEQAKSFNFQLDQLKSTLGAVVIEFGQRMVPVMKIVVSLFKFFAGVLHAIPGPAKTLLAILAGIVAVMTTAGLTLFVLKSKLNMVALAFRTLGATGAGQSLLGFARNSTIASTSLSTLTRATGLSGASFGKIAAGLGLAATAFLSFGPAVSGVMDFINGKPEVDAYAAALIEWGDAGTYAGTKLEQDFGGGLGKIAGNIKKIAHGEGNSVLGDILDTVGLESLDAKLDESKKEVDGLDKAFAKLVTGGHVTLAKSQFENVKTALKAEGITDAELTQFFDDYQAAILGVDEANKGAAGSTGKHAEAAESITDKLKAADDAAKEYADSIKDLQAQSGEWLSLSNVLGKVEESHKKTFDTAEKARQAAESQAKATKDNKNAQEDLAKAQDKVNKYSNAAPGSKNWDNLKDAQNGVADAAERLRDNQAQVNAEYEKTAPTLDEIISTYQSQIDAFNSFQANLQIAAARGVPMEVIRELQGMGEEGVEVAAQLASAPLEEFDKLKGILAEKVRMQGEEFQRELDIQLTTAAAVAKAGANKTVAGILEEVLKLAPGINAALPEVAAALGRLGIGTNPSDIVPDNFVGPLGPNQVKSGDLPKTVAQNPGEKDPWNRTVVSKKIAGPLTAQEVYSSIADRGAVIKPGYNMIQNKTALPEYVLTAGQMQGLKPAPPKPAASMRPVESKSTTYQFGDIYAQDLTAAMRQADQKKRLGALAGG